MRPEPPIRPFGFAAVATISASRGHAARCAYKASIAASVWPEKARSKNRDMPGLARGHAGGHVLGRRQGRPRRRGLAFPHQDLGLAGMGQGETGVGGEGAVEGLDRAGIQGQRQIVALT